MLPNTRKTSSRGVAGSLAKSPTGARLLMWATLGLLLYITYSYLGGSYGLIQLWRLHQRELALNREVMRLQVQQDSLRREIKLLQTDSTYIEKIARARYKLGKPGEKIYTIVKPEKP